MLRIRILSLLAASLLMFLVAACSSETIPEEAASDEMAGDETAEVDFEDLEEFDANNFDDTSTTINNRWSPLQPGTQWVFEGFTVEDGESIPHRVVFTVTDLTKVIEGVRTVVVWDQDFADDELVETELALFAQDKNGNVWHFGQYPEEYEEGEFVDAPAWIAGVEDAQAGISMKSEPRLGTPSYSQGWAPAVNWTDRAQVYKMRQHTCVPADCYTDVLVMEEFSQEEPDAFQLKYYAPGVGNVRVGWRGADESQETLELVEHVQLDPVAMAEVREQALELESRAYEISPDVYGQTPPSETPLREMLARKTSEEPFEEFDHDNFNRSTTIDNQWMPMQPGTQWSFEGFTMEINDLIPHHIVFTVTDLTKEIDGVPTVVAYIEDHSNDELVEAEIAFYAQDNDGNVWYLGEYPEEYKNGEFVNAPAWIAGLENARAGIKMPVEPQKEKPSFSQGWAPMVNWSDRGQVYQMDKQTCVPFDCYEDVLIMDEFSQAEPGAFQLKYYARGVGQVRVGWRGNDQTQETLELVDLVQLDAEALAEVREKALNLEARAYDISPNVYGQTPPAEQMIETETASS